LRGTDNGAGSGDSYAFGAAGANINAQHIQLLHTDFIQLKIAGK